LKFEDIKLDINLINQLDEKDEEASFFIEDFIKYAYKELKKKVNN
jgi:hypothetical protein